MNPRDEKRERPLFGVVLSLAAAGALVVSTVAGAEGAKTPPPPVPHSPSQVLTGAAGQEVAIDPASGKLRQPPPAEVQALVKALAPFFASTEESPIVQRGANGMASVDLSGRFHNMAIATVQADGSLSWGCVNNLAGVSALLTGPPALEER